MTLLLLALALSCRKKDQGDESGDTADSGAPEVPSLVPAPILLEVGTGSFVLSSDIRIAAPGLETTATLLAEALRPSTGFSLDVTEEERAPGDISLVLDPTLDVSPEGYVLDVDAEGVHIVAADEDGIFWATQTLRQLLPPETLGPTPFEGSPEIPFVHIEDAPRFAWRGHMLDVARHFFTKAEVERQIDLLALHKLNRLHVHLTDDQGWRIEIESWPDLTAIGGSTEVGGGIGGFYTQDDWADLVAYGEARHVLLIPEIDLPGHAHAARASYAELNEDGKALEPYTGESVISTPFWLDGPSTEAFVIDVWSEVAAITPSPWVHIGGDEAIDYTDEEYVAFIRWLQTVVAAEGKTAIGWDEIGIAGLEAPFVAQYWWHIAGAQAAALDGAGVIVSQANRAYLDMVHDGDADFGQIWAGAVDVEYTYVWDPVPGGLDAADVLGIEAPLWTELIPTIDEVDLMTWPRLSSLAEVAWTPQDARVWEDFRLRLGWHGRRLDALGVGFYASPEIDWE